MQGQAPVGRYGHAVTMAGTRFIVFGGQVDGEFLNDIWSFDLSTCEFLFHRFYQRSLERQTLHSENGNSMGVFGAYHDRTASTAYGSHLHDLR